jgi:hypothetical protein
MPFVMLPRISGQSAARSAFQILFFMVVATKPVVEIHFSLPSKNQFAYLTVRAMPNPFPIDFLGNVLAIVAAEAA